MVQVQQTHATVMLRLGSLVGFRDQTIMHVMKNTYMILENIYIEWKIGNGRPDDFR